MGATSPFDNSADFSGITGKRELKISNVIHKAVVEMNEEGTVAAAATAVVVVRITYVCFFSMLFFLMYNA